MILFIITCFGFAVTTNPIMLLILFGVYGAFNVATDGIQKAFAVDLLPTDLKGTGIGLLQTSIGLAGIVGGVTAGFLYDIDSSYAFLYGGILTGVTLLLLVFLKINDRKPSEKSI